MRKYIWPKSKYEYPLILGNALTIPLKNESVHCVVTSPPYWKLRDYGVKGQLGMEKSPEEYVNNLVKVFQEVHRVLRKDGTCWLNLGDSYRNKNLAGIPWRVASALQNNGWILRSDIIWNKPNVMPESVKDRPTMCHEYIFLFSKNLKYYFDDFSVRGKNVSVHHGDVVGGNKYKQNPYFSDKNTGRNIQSVWTIPTQTFSGAHFATFPEELVKRCIMAGTSEKGCCFKCGKPWERVFEKISTKVQKEKVQNRKDALLDIPGAPTYRGGSRNDGLHSFVPRKFIGWRPSCDCDAKNPTPCVCFDPFTGISTVGRVAYKYGRKFVGLDLKREYLKMGSKRMSGEK